MKKPCLLIFFTLIGFLAIAQRHTYVRVVSKKNFNAKTDSVLRAALPLIDSVINSPAFREGILQAKFLNAKELANADILRLLLSGKEVHGDGPNDTLDLVLETYPDQNGDNIGTTYGSKRIVSSEAYILRNGARCYAAHIIHEYCHTIGDEESGFGHVHRVLTRKQRRKK